MQRLPAATDEKKAKKSGGDDGLTRAMKKMLVLKQAAARRKHPAQQANQQQQPQQAQQQERAHPAAPEEGQQQQQQAGAGQQPEAARGHEAPAAQSTQQRGQQGQQAKAQQAKQGPDSLFQQKRLKVREGGLVVADRTTASALPSNKRGGCCVQTCDHTPRLPASCDLSLLLCLSPSLSPPAARAALAHQDKKKEYLKQKKLKKKGRGAEPLLGEREAALAARTAATAPRLGEASWGAG